MKRKSRPREQIKMVKGDRRGVFFDLFDPDEAAELTMRAELLFGLQNWLVSSGLTQIAAATELGLTQAGIGYQARQNRFVQSVTCSSALLPAPDFIQDFGLPHKKRRRTKLMLAP